ncbi:MAG: S-layer homology domain-containing protein, partial [Oscillospiraceae bacterium]|nr:S-layer homology domain-containing protein [Oscillospiraceae bacterium]
MDFTDLYLEKAFSNVYYLPQSGNTLFGSALSPMYGNDGFGTDRVKTVIRSKTADEFKSATLASALNNGRTGADAPWEYIEGNDYPTLKFERADYDPDEDVYVPPATGGDIKTAAGYGGNITFDDGVFTITPDDGYKIDIVYIDSVPTNAYCGTESAEIAASELDGADGIVATFAYTVNFNIPANGTLSVSRGANTLTSGSIVRAGEILTVTATPGDGYELNTENTVFSGLTAVDAEAGTYKVTALRADPPSVTVAFQAIGENPSEEPGENPNENPSEESADKTALNAAITLAGTKNEADYTPNSWSALQSALTTARDVLADDNATQTAVDTAAANLTTAIGALTAGSGSSNSSGSSGSSGGGGGGGTPEATPTPTPSAVPDTTAESGVTITAETIGEVYGDVRETDWYAPDVAFVTAQGLMKGKGDTGTFAPEDSTTRAEWVTILARLEDAPAANENSSPWYQAVLDWATAEGLTDGAAPTASITREQLVTILWRLNGSPASNADADLTGVSDWARDAVAWAV